MKHIIKVDTDDGKDNVVFSTDELDNLNFVEMNLGEWVATLSIDDLKVIADALIENRKLVNEAVNKL